MANMSFLPEDYLERRIELRTNAICLVLFVVVFAVVVWVYYGTNRERHEVMDQHRQINARFADAANRITQVEELQKRRQDMIRKANVTRSLVESVPRTLILSELINLMPPNLSLLSLELETKVTQRVAPKATALEDAKAKAQAKKQPAPEMVNVTDVYLRLVGVAPTDVEVSDYLEALGRCNLLRDVSLSYSEEITLEGKTLRKFMFRMALNQQVDVRQVEPTLVARSIKRNPMGPPINPREQAGNPDVVPIRQR